MEDPEGFSCSLALSKVLLLSPCFLVLLLSCLVIPRVKVATVFVMYTLS